MGLISPKELNEDHRLWLSVPHELHEPLFGLMKKLFPGFNFTDVHCFQCEGERPFKVTIESTGKEMLCTGYYLDLVEGPLLRLKDVGQEVPVQEKGGAR